MFNWQGILPLSKKIEEKHLQIIITHFRACENWLFLNKSVPLFTLFITLWKAHIKPTENFSMCLLVLAWVWQNSTHQSSRWKFINELHYNLFCRYIFFNVVGKAFADLWLHKYPFKMWTKSLKWYNLLNKVCKKIFSSLS